MQCAKKVCHAFEVINSHLTNVHYPNYKLVTDHGRGFSSSHDADECEVLGLVAIESCRLVCRNYRDGFRRC